MNPPTTTSSGRDPRQPLIDSLHRTLHDSPWAIAAWLGGSDASGRVDGLSDIDLVTIVEDERVDDTFTMVETALRRVAPIVRTLRLPEPTWHGHAQAFYQLDGWAEWHMVDLVVQRRGGPPSRFLEPERHGIQRVLFDREGLVQPAPFDRVGHAKLVAARREHILARFDLLQHLVTKAILRGDAAEAVDRYMSFALRPLVELLRIQFCPDRFDFGMRYLDRDLPAALHREIAELSLPGSLQELTRAHERAKALFAAAEAATAGVASQPN